MKLNVAKAFFTLPPSQEGWAQVYEEPGFIAVISVINPIQTSQTIERQIFTSLQKNLSESVDRDIKAILESGLAQTSREFSQNGQVLEIVSLVTHGDHVYLASTGHAQAIILRHGKLARLVGANQKPVETAIGNLEPDDALLLGTNLFIKQINLNVIKDALSVDPKTGVTKFRPLAKQGPVAACLIKFHSGQGVHQITTPHEPNPNQAMPQEFKPSQFRLKLVSIIDKLLKHLPERKIVVHSELGDLQTKKKKRVIVTAGGMLLVILALSIVFGIKQKNISISKSKYETRLSQAKHDFEEAQNLSSLNPSRARELVLGAKTQVATLQSEGIKDPEIDSLAADIQNELGQIAGIYEITPDMYFDLTIYSSGLKGDGVAISDDRVAVLDKDGKRLVSIKVDTKNAQIAAGPQVMPAAQDFTIYSDRNFVLTNSGIWEVGDEAHEVIKSDWSGPVLPFAYTGNIYVLEKNNSAIWRYAGDGGALFGAKQNWFGPGVSPDLSKVKAWHIDGSVWLLTDDNDIFKFTQGHADNFNLSDSSFTATDFFVSHDTQYLYILDAASGRILVYDKEGEFKAQYVSDQIKDAKRIVVSETSKKILLLTGPKLLSIDIKHM